MEDEQIVNSTVTDDDLDVSEEGLAKLKAESEGVETSKEEDEPDEIDQEDGTDEDTGEEGDQIADESAEDEDSQEEESFVKEFPNIKGDTPEEYAKNLEIAYKNSTAEALRLKGVAEAPSTTPPVPEAPEDGQQQPVPPTDTLSIWAKQKLDQEIDTAYIAFQKDYPQVTEPEKYTEFTREVSVLADTIMRSQGRLASPDEVYSKAAISLGWTKGSEPDSKEQLGMALKDRGASSKASGAAKTTPKTPKVSQAMLEANRKMYPNKSDADIIKELTPFIS